MQYRFIAELAWIKRRSQKKPSQDQKHNCLSKCNDAKWRQVTSEPYEYQGVAMRFLVFAAMVLWPTAILAAPVVYECKFKKSSDGWIQETITARIDSKTGAVDVFDRIVSQTNNGKPVAGQYKKTNNGRLRVKWDLKDLETTQISRVRTSWTLTINPNDMSAMAVARLDVGGSSSRRGACKIIQ